MTQALVREQAPDYRRYVVSVAASASIGPNLQRITLCGEDLHQFGVAGCDQRVKLLLPRRGRTVADVPVGEGWYARWRALPEGIRPVMRTYTVRAHRPETGEMDIDLVLHGTEDGTAGPAAHWAATARPGHQVALIGPDRPGDGMMWGRAWAPPASTDQVLLAGDETAVPAVAAIVESLPGDARGITCLEVPSRGDVQHWHAPRGMDIRWYSREEAATDAAHGALLEPAVRQAVSELAGSVAAAPGCEQLDEVNVDTDLLWDVPERRATAELYAWLAGEAAMIKRLRRLMVGEHGIPRASVAFMGYWRSGRPEPS